MTYKELVYMALDALKIHSDDSKFTEDHVIFLLNKYRAYALRQKYSKTLEEANLANYQSILVEINMKHGFFNGGAHYNSVKAIPNILDIALPKIELSPFNTLEIVFISNNRFKYVGNNKFLSNILYACISNDKYLWIKGKSDIIASKSYLYLHAIFSNPLEVDDYNNETVDVLDREFPMEEDLVPGVLELVLKDLTNGIYKPSDNTNDAQDALSDLAGFLRRNMKSQFQKQVDE